MKNHKFKFLEKFGEKNIYLVSCKKTGGDFSTKLWIIGKEKQNICPCCGEEIKNDN